MSVVAVRDPAQQDPSPDGLARVERATESGTSSLTCAQSNADTTQTAPMFPQTSKALEACLAFYDLQIPS